MNFDKRLRLAHVRFNVRWTSSFTAVGVLGAWLAYKQLGMDLSAFYAMVPLGALAGLITVWPMWAMVIRDLTIIKLQNEDKLLGAEATGRMELAPGVSGRGIGFEQEFRLARVRFYVGWNSIFTLGGVLAAWMLYPHIEMGVAGFYVLVVFNGLTGLITAWPMWMLMIRDLTLIDLQNDRK